MEQRKYEVFFIVDPDLSDGDVKALETKLREIVAREGGVCLSYDSWGKKKLAYPVKKKTRGHYFLMVIEGAPAVPHELERNLRIDERVLKFITVKLDDRGAGNQEAEKATRGRKRRRERVEDGGLESPAPSEEMVAEDAGTP